MSDIKLKNKQGEEVTLRNMEVIALADADGGEDIEFVHPSGKATITSTSEIDVTNYATAQVVDSDLVAGNIRKNVDILGVTGTLEEGITPSGNVYIERLGTVNVTNYATAQVFDNDIVENNIRYGVSILGVNGTLVERKPEQTKTVDLEMASGDQLISPDSGKVLTSVTVNKPSTMVPENIKKDVDIAGVIGTFEGSGGGGGSSDSGVIFIDYDGEIVEQWASGDVASKSALPNNPSHTGLTAQGWNWSLANIKSYILKYPEATVVVGQMYATASGLTEFDITLTKVTGLMVICQMSGNKNWGDGTTDNLTSHTYSNYGDYTITCDGTTMPSYTISPMGSGEHYCKNIRISNRVTSINGNAFNTLISLKSITIPNSVTSIGNNMLGGCSSLTSIIIPSSITSIESSTFSTCYSLTFVSIPHGVTSIGRDAFNYCASLESIAIPSSVTNIDYKAFEYCYSLRRITIPNGVESIGDSTFFNCYSLKSITIPNSVTSIGSKVFYNCYSLTSLTIPNSVTSIGENMVSTCNSLKRITILSSVISIGATAFSYCRSVIKYDFSNATAVPTLSAANTFMNINGTCKIIVPDALYDDWIVATYWSTYANYIYKASEVTE